MSHLQQIINAQNELNKKVKPKEKPFSCDKMNRAFDQVFKKPSPAKG